MYPRDIFCIIVEYIPYSKLAGCLAITSLSDQEKEKIQRQVYNARLTVTVSDTGVMYRIDNLLHREDGPAFELFNRNWSWYKHGKLHNPNGPARILDDGQTEWWQNGKLHNPNGPAKIFANGKKTWYVYGIHITPF